MDFLTGLVNKAKSAVTGTPAPAAPAPAVTDA